MTDRIPGDHSPGARICQGLASRLPRAHLDAYTSTRHPSEWTREPHETADYVSTGHLLRRDKLPASLQVDSEGFAVDGTDEPHDNREPIVARLDGLASDLLLLFRRLEVTGNQRIHQLLRHFQVRLLIRLLLLELHLQRTRNL